MKKSEQTETFTSSEESGLRDLVGAFEFIIDSLESARMEAANTQDAIARNNIVAARYHLMRFAAYARSSTKTFAELVVDSGK